MKLEPRAMVLGVVAVLAVLGPVEILAAAETSPASTAQQTAPAEAPAYGEPISLDEAKFLANFVETHAPREVAGNLTIAVVQPSGDLVYFERMDNATAAAGAIAVKKACMAARYRVPSGTMPAGTETLPDVIVFHGGVPVVFHGRTIGALGIDGAGHGLAQPLAQQAIEALEKTR